MKSITIAICTLGLVLNLNSCKDTDPNPQPNPDPNALKVLTLGDSRVEGARPEYESYRFELWKNFVQADWAVDFLGRRRDAGDYPQEAGLSFDPDHQGTGGEVSAGLLNTLRDYEAPLDVEVALVGIGGNDLLDGGESVTSVLDNISQIVTELRRLNSGVVILVEQIAPIRSDLMVDGLPETLTEFHSGIAELVSNLSTMASPVIAIDMAPGWSDSLLADEVHYNTAGAKLVADRYFAAIEANLPR
ncbi:MAG: GDSL-type esterase/lipase family protein [Bacteroidota bacterium]